MLEDRAEVHQATGMVAEQAGVSRGQALVLLRARLRRGAADHRSEPRGARRGGALLQ
ncbi:MAG TPA: hypothetical protein VFR74_03860 [Jiangellales bacterium]|nr:hypothetical protein [Jiangellales bacterium]